ncbi:CerR family C-terminal domain-containing protein [Planctomicrobium piriforme]|uniref:DNA-binding transcriptional regulator, AcrR family n=1 Tax=Planctomicrobium piriforme TaxID=1576369 RepID=A0A1I3EPM8_9PLAN|nr:CerR family C-terminal domain-containing protein [Planctomicrobium piriforme]SFI00858.1 DNA-binding transcriptional regulator, AcrR family [Planctomicrobium piriforme]
MDDTRQRLVNTAGQIFAEKGFDLTTVREICTAAEANIAAVHYHFGDKLRLYVEVVRLASCDQGEPPTFAWSEQTPPEDRLRDFVRHMLTLMIDNDRPTWQIDLMMREMGRPSVATQEVVESYIRPMFEGLIDIVGRFLPPDATPMQKQLQAFSIIAQCLLYRYHRPIGRLLVGEEQYQRFFDLDLLTEHVVRFSAAGLRAFPGARQESPA